MQEKVGTWIKRIAIILFIVEVLLVAVAELIFFSILVSVPVGYESAANGSASGTTFFIAIVVFLIAVIAAFIPNMLMYGFGVLIEHNSYTRHHLEYIRSQMYHGDDTADGIEFLCNQSMDIQKTLHAIYVGIAPNGEKQTRGVTTHDEWVCPQCETINPSLANYCMKCGKKAN